MQPIHPSVFVILPLEPINHVERVYERQILPALGYFHFAADRADKDAFNDPIMDEIHRRIDNSLFVIADVSFERPNCYYEIGYANGRGKYVFLICHQNSKPHFDLSNKYIHRFSDDNAVGKLLINKLPTFLRSPRRTPLDNRNGKFGSQCIRDGYRLCARVDSCDDEECELTFEVISLDRNKPLDQPVTFHLHKSYDKSVQQIKPKEGIARWSGIISNDGPFTLGATIKNTDVRLELDLAMVPGAEEWWYSEAVRKR